MELRRLRYLAVVAEHGSIGRAARVLGIAQPALSRHLRAIEEIVEVPMLERSQKGVKLSAAGRAFLGFAGGIEGLLGAAIRDARLTAEGRIGRLRISLGRIALDDPRVGRAIESVRLTEPGIELDVRELGSPSHTLALLRGDTDLAIGSEESPAHRRLSRRALDTEVIDSALLPDLHPLARRDAVEAHELEALPYLMAGGPTGWVFPQVREALRKLGFAAPLEYETVETVYALVAAGRGWTPISRSYALRAPGGTVTVPLRGLRVELPLSLRWRRGDDSPALARVSRILPRGFRSGPATGGAPLDPGSRDSVRAAAGTPGEPRAERGSLESAIAGRLEARHLRALVTIANDGSLADAARRLDVTQSAVSRQLASLERIVGTPLFRRTRLGATPTAAGEVMRAGATEVLRVLAAASVGARLASAGIERRCVIGIVPSPVASDSLISLLRRAPVELPSLAIEVREMASPHLADALRSGELDVALMMLRDAQAPDAALSVRFLANDPYDSVVVSARGPLAGRASLTATDLADMPFCFFARAENPTYHDAMLNELRRLGIEPRLGASYRGPRAMWRFVADGDGWAIGLRSMRAAPPLGVVAIALEGLCIQASLHVVSRRDERDPHVLALVAAL